MPHRLILTQNAQFYKPNSAICDDTIREIIDKASENIETGIMPIINVFREQRYIDNSHTSYTVSVKVFPTLRRVFFVEMNEEEEPQDRIYAYIVLIEIAGIMAVLKKSCNDITDIIEKKYEIIDHTKWIATFNDEDVEFQKLSLRNMTVSMKAVRTRTYEASDLKGILSTHAAGKSIPFYIKISKGNIATSISAYSGRVVEASARKSIDDIAKWIAAQMTLVQAAQGEKTFLDAFAKMIQLSEVMDCSRPVAILVESSRLFEKMSEANTQLVGLSKNKPISDNLCNRLRQRLEQVYTVEDNNTVSGTSDTAKIKVNRKTITFKSRQLSKIGFIDNGRKISLQSYIVANKLYSVCFTNPKYMYFMGKCFEDASGISEINSLLDLFHPINALVNAKSEKGTFTTATKNFDNDSIFGIVEHEHRSADYIFCDDLGNEWADHIILTKEDPQIIFIHSKYGELTTSASKLHDVVGQAIKNLGHMIFSKEVFRKKVENKLKSIYQSPGVVTKISRDRKGVPPDIDCYLGELINDYRLRRQCILACSFISKAQIEMEFDHIRKGENVAGHIIQMFWMISSFAHAAKEMNIRPTIYCRP